MKKKRVLVWFRQDLRLHDNEALTDALRAGDEVALVYVFDKRIFENLTRYGFAKTSVARKKFIIESVRNLRDSIRKKGSELIVRVGYPEEELYRLAMQYQTSWVFCNRERTAEEVAVQDALEKNLWEVGQEMVYSRGKMLYYTQDLPFPVSHTPDTFGQFRKEVERIIPVREPLPVPSVLKPLSQTIDAGNIPSLEDFTQENNVDGYPQPEGDELEGGETRALTQLESFLRDDGFLQRYHKEKDGFTPVSGLSAWLAQGCLSPKMIYARLDNALLQKNAKKAAQAIKGNLMYRDYLRLLGKKYGNKIFRPSGMSGLPVSLGKDDMETFYRWAHGKTGVPIVDAVMRQLNKTGFITHKSRQVAAGFLVHDLGINWIIGAEYFESRLIDYDPMSNWCNWNMIAGVGTDNREGTQLNLLAQAKRFDPKGVFVRKWIPELKGIPTEKLFCLEQLSEEEQQAAGLILGIDYPLALPECS